MICVNLFTTALHNAIHWADDATVFEPAGKWPHQVKKWLLELAEDEREHVTPGHHYELLRYRVPSPTVAEINRLGETLRASLVELGIAPFEAPEDPPMPGEHLTPTNETQAKIESLFLILRTRRNDPPPTLKTILPLVRSDSDFSSNQIAAHRTTLLCNQGVHSDTISLLVRDIEWSLGRKYRPVSAYLFDRFDRGYLALKLRQDPSAFTTAELHLVMTDHRDDGLREVAHKALLASVVSFAERLTNPPLRMSEDIASVAQRVKDYGFDPDLNTILDRVDLALGSDPDEFEQISVMREIRAFFEKFHMEVASELQKRVPSTANKTPLDRTGQVIEYLKLQDVISDDICALGKAIYQILSDRDYGVHAIKATRDYTRLCRNMMIEYAIVLLLELERRVALEVASSA